MKKHQNKDNLISSIRNRITNPTFPDYNFNNDQNSDHEIAVLLGELQIAQLELEMQNEELFVSSQLLELERAKFEQLFNFAPVGYFILDRLGVIEEYNKAGAELLDLPQTSSLSWRFLSFIAPEDWENFYLFLRSLQDTNTKQSRDIKLLLKNGTSYYTRIEGIKSKSTTDQLQYYITVTDITERRLSEQNLLATTQRLEMTLSSSGTGTWTLDLESRKIYMDDLCYSLFEINKSEFDGTIKGFIQLILSDDREMILHRLSNSINNIHPIALEFRILTNNNEIKVLSLKGKEVKNDSFHRLYAGILVDITLQQTMANRAKQQQSEKQRLILSTTIDAQEKERQKISAALHDSVCQLLYGVKLNLQNIQKTNNLRTEFKNINNLLDQAISETRALSYDLTPSVLRDFGFTAGVKEIAQRLTTCNFEVETLIKPEADSLKPNLQLIVFRIMQELLNNCIKHSKATLAKIKIDVEGEMVTLLVSDNGKGLEGTLEQALTNGSGLRGIKHRLSLLEGSIGIDSAANGTTITVILRKDLKLSDF